MPRQLRGRKIVFLLNGTGTTGYPHEDGPLPQMTHLE